jgi:hypothetical protein
MIERSKFFVIAILLATMIVIGLKQKNLLLELKNLLPKKAFNRKRKREEGLDHISRFNDQEVKQQTSLSRSIFNFVLKLIEPKLRLSPVQERMARVSSGEPMPIITKLFIALRILKGAKVHDLSNFTSGYNDLWKTTFIPVMKAIDASLDNVHFKPDDAQWRDDTADQWAWQQKRKYNNCFWWGLLACGDGLILKVRKFSVEYCTFLGLQVSKFWNRKGYYGVNVQAFCDAWCRFVAVEIHAPGATHDLRAYMTGEIFKALSGLPNDFYLALDEAYKGIHDGRHMTPYPMSEIDKARNDGLPAVAQMMRTYNKIFCSDRITIERAFGIFMRRYPLFWIAYPSEDIEELRLVFRTACKLHNLCIDEWLLLRFGPRDLDYVGGTDYPHPKLPVYIPNSEDATKDGMGENGSRDFFAVNRPETTVIENRGLGSYALRTHNRDTTTGKMTQPLLYHTIPYHTIPYHTIPYHARYDDSSSHRRGSPQSNFKSNATRRWQSDYQHSD